MKKLLGINLLSKQINTGYFVTMEFPMKLQIYIITKTYKANKYTRVNCKKQAYYGETMTFACRELGFTCAKSCMQYVQGIQSRYVIYTVLYKAEFINNILRI